MSKRLELRSVTKRYPGVVANADVSLSVEPGEIHAVLGENGAGKSTLMKIIYGAVKADEGEMLFNGQSVSIADPLAARQLGISMVFQHFSLFDSLSVGENIWLGLDKAGSLADVCERATSKAKAYGLDIDTSRPVHTLSVGEMQRVEIVRALMSDPQLLILDEPTSVLTPQAVEQLFAVLRQLADQGCSILYISHKLHEIRALCTACTVLRGGRVTGYCDPREESNASLSRLMIGEEPPALPTRPSQVGQTVLSVKGLSLRSDDPFGTDLEAVSLTVAAGEIVGIAGVSGNGQKELLMALSGEDPRAEAQAIELLGQAVGRLPPARRRDLGQHFVPEERLGRGAIPSWSLAQNVLLSRREAVRHWPGLGQWIAPKQLKTQAEQIIARFGVKANGASASAKSLSGGNLQKFIMGREIGAKPKMLIVSQPTWGVDVGAAALIRTELLALRDTGCAILVVSEELDELFELSDRLYVMAKGRLSPALPRAQASLALVGQWMSGLWQSGADGLVFETVLPSSSGATSMAGEALSGGQHVAA